VQSDLEVVVSKVNSVSFLVPRFPSKSGLIHKYIVKHIVNKYIVKHTVKLS
jgi:hypothetical protein